MRKPGYTFGKIPLFVCLLLALGSAGGFGDRRFLPGEMDCLRWDLSSLQAAASSVIRDKTAPQGPECGPSFWKAPLTGLLPRRRAPIFPTAVHPEFPVAIFEDESGNPLLAQCFEQTQFTLVSC